MDYLIHSGPHGAQHVKVEMIVKKNVAVLGLGETGLASALFLKKKGYRVFVSDRETNETLEKRSSRLKEENIPFELGGHHLEKIGECHWAVISPGIHPSSEVYQTLRKKSFPLVSEVEVASWFSPGEVTAVTGTSGKSTVTTLLARIYQANGLPSLACGNIGNPWIGEIEQMTSETQVVLEVSSFQLLHTHSLRPRLGILLNIGRNHLDWHPTLEDYVTAKLRLFQNQAAEDYAFLRQRDQRKFFPHFSFKGQVIYWDEKEEKNSNEELLFEVTRIRRLAPEKTRGVLSRFEGLEHRLEKVAEIDGVHFINDSKCTTLEALVWALAKFPDQRVILLAGGHDKGADFRSVRDWLSKKVKRAVVFGEAQDLLWRSWMGAAPLVRAEALTEAFREALKAARSGDTVLLSPACASFDQFANYGERGKMFKRLVGEAKKESSLYVP